MDNLWDLNVERKLIVQVPPCLKGGCMKKGNLVYGKQPSTTLNAGDPEFICYIIVHYLDLAVREQMLKFTPDRDVVHTNGVWEFKFKDYELYVTPVQLQRLEVIVRTVVDRS